MAYPGLAAKIWAILAANPAATGKQIRAALNTPAAIPTISRIKRAILAEAPAGARARPPGSGRGRVPTGLGRPDPSRPSHLRSSRP